MRLWIDCEWNSFGGDLISMALVDEDGRSFYEVVDCKHPEPWVAQNVIPNLGKPPVGGVTFQMGLCQFLAQYDDIHVIADWPEDIAYFCKALITGPGVRMQTPPMTMEVVRIDAASDLPHNALEDARGIRRAMMEAA